jgi:hypothetical protein
LVSCELELAGKPTFKIEERVHFAGFIGEMAECQGEQGIGPGFGIEQSLAVDFVLHERRLKYPDAAEIPAGAGGDLDEQPLLGANGAKILLEPGTELVEGGGLIGRDYGFDCP